MVRIFSKGWLLAAVLAAGTSQAMAAPTAMSECHPAQSTFGFVQLLCDVGAKPNVTFLRFEASFGGVHDDSSARLTPQLDGVALSCDAASRLQLQGEAEGDKLSCGFTLPPSARRRELRLYLEWHHAEPTGYRWTTSP